MLSQTESQRRGLIGSPVPRKSSHIVHKYEVGDCVEISQSRVALIKYIGKVRDMRGIWYGIEFIDGSLGSHNGTLKNTFYFSGADKRCEFIQKGSIRRRFKTKAQSARNILKNKRESMLFNEDGVSQPQLNHIIDSNHIITLKLRCMCCFDPVPMELKIDINQQTMRHLKRQIINECNGKTNLALFKSIIDSKGWCSAVDVYQFIDSSSNKRNRNIKTGNMSYCILKKNQSLFKKLSLQNNNDSPLKYYKLMDGEELFVLFNFECSIKIIFQKSLFIKNERKDDGEQRLKKVISDDAQYIHQHILSVNIQDKFDVLYLKLMKCTAIQNINSIKLLSNTFIYNKSMMIEKFICNEIDETDGGDDSEELFLYFLHLDEHDLNKNKTTKGNNHHISRSRTRNYSLINTFSSFQHSKHTVIHQSTKYTKVLLNFVSAKKSESYTILNEDITIKQLKDNISRRYKIDCDRIKLNNDILDNDKVIKHYNLNTNDILHIFDEENAHFIRVQISQSVLSGIDSAQKEFDTKINDKLTIKHLKYQISKILRYPIFSQTLIMKEVLKDDESIAYHGIKDGDTLRLVYNFGKRVRKLPNQRIKIPISTFIANKKFDIIVNKDIFIYDIMIMIQREKGVDCDKQQLLFHGVILDKEQRLNSYNITHEVHLLITK